MKRTLSGSKVKELNWRNPKIALFFLLLLFPPLLADEKNKSKAKGYKWWMWLNGRSSPTDERFRIKRQLRSKGVLIWAKLQTFLKRATNKEGSKILALEHTLFQSAPTGKGRLLIAVISYNPLGSRKVYLHRYKLFTTTSTMTSRRKWKSRRAVDQQSRARASIDSISLPFLRFGQRTRACKCYTRHWLKHGRAEAVTRAVIELGWSATERQPVPWQRCWIMM